MKKRILAIFMCTCLLFTLAPTAFAEDGDKASETEQTAETETEQIVENETIEMIVEHGTTVVIEDATEEEPTETDEVNDKVKITTDENLIEELSGVDQIAEDEQIIEKSRLL